jgi:GNAT superfamily N-acetyltransferase
VPDADALLAAYDEQMRERVPAHPPAGVRYEWDGPLLRVVGQHRGFVSTPRDVGLRGSELDELIARQRDYFAARGEAFEWKTRGHDLPPDLTDRLRAAGFVPEDDETVLIGLAGELAAEPALPAGVTLRRVNAEADLRRIADMNSVVWGQDMGWLADSLSRQIAADPAGIEVLVAEAGGGDTDGDGDADGDVVSAAWLTYEAGTEFAGLWGGSTLPGWRGRGIYRALVARRAQLAVARGVTYLQVDASADSSPILRRLGLQAVTTTTPYVWAPTAAAAP